jgi:hypothetical protein
MTNQSKFRKYLLMSAIIFIISIGSAIAQPGLPGGDPSGEPGGPVGTGVPLDGGSIFMLIAGVAYGAQRLKTTVVKVQGKG